MARAIADIARDIQALSADDKGELLLALMEELDAPSNRELEVLAKQLAVSVQRTNEALDVAIARLDGLDDKLERGAAEARERALHAADVWPFTV